MTISYRTSDLPNQTAYNAKRLLVVQWLEEGGQFSLDPYFDSDGLVTIGIGFNLIVLGSDCAPVRDVIMDGYNGILVDFFDTEKIAASVIEVLSSSRFVQLRRNARLSMVESFTANQGLRAYQDLLN